MELERDLVIVFQLHLVACAFMTGVIWIIQTLHYPAFTQIRESGFKDFHFEHSRKITFIVGPMMLIELVTGVILVWQTPSNMFIALNLLIVIALWLSTGLLSVPQHNRLVNGQDAKVIDRLVLTNWPRTVMWSSRLVALLFHGEV